MPCGARGTTGGLSTGPWAHFLCEEAKKRPVQRRTCPEVRILPSTTVSDDQKEAEEFKDRR